MLSGNSFVSLRWFGVLVALLAFVLIPFYLFAAATESFTSTMLTSSVNLWSLAAACIALLALDVFLPVPSSVVSTMAGGLFGFAAGTGVSVVGMTLSCGVGWLFGRYAGRPGVDAMLGVNETQRLQEFFRRHGMLTIVVSRAVPVAAEASIILAAAAGTGFRRTFIVAGLSNLGISIVYAAVGAYAWTQQSFALAFLAAIGVPLLAFAVLRRLNDDAAGIAGEQG